MFGKLRVDVEHCDLFNQFKAEESHTESPEQEYSERSPEHDGEWTTHNSELKPRPRPSYKQQSVKSNYMVAIRECCDSGGDPTASSAMFTTFVGESKKHHNGAISMFCMHLALMAHHDLDWRKVLKLDDREAAIQSLHKEKESFHATILERVHPGHTDHEEAVRTAVSGRYILDLKRSQVWKTRCETG